MPFSLILGLSLASEWQRTELKSLFSEGPNLVVRSLVGRLEPPKVSPRDAWTFDRLSLVSVSIADAEADRIRVFGQSATSGLLSPEAAARFLALLFDFNYSALKLDHSPQFGDGCIDVYLASEGPAGGEQLFGEDPLPMRAYVTSNKVNMVYVYQAQGVKNPLEACRELAHEYGHATLPPVRVPGGREEWANGDLGERLFLSWISDQVQAGTVPAGTVFGVPKESLSAYRKTKIDRLTLPVGTTGPDLDALKHGGAKGFDAYLGTALYAYQTLPVEVFRRSLVLNPDQSPNGYAKALLEAVSERRTVEVRTQGRKTLWVPTGSGKIENGTVKAKRDGWSLVAVTGKLRIRN